MTEPMLRRSLSELDLQNGRRIVLTSTTVEDRRRRGRAYSYTAIPLSAVTSARLAATDRHWVWLGLIILSVIALVGVFWRLVAGGLAADSALLAIGVCVAMAALFGSLWWWSAKMEVIIKSATEEIHVPLTPLAAKDVESFMDHFLEIQGKVALA